MTTATNLPPTPKPDGYLTMTLADGKTVEFGAITEQHAVAFAEAAYAAGLDAAAALAADLCGDAMAQLITDLKELK